MSSARLEAALCASLIALTAFVYLEYPRYSAGGYTSGTPPSYYGLLTESFAAGQASLKIAPDPKLLRLADPYAGPQGAARPHDMSFYKGKFYLYYGPTPALVLALPWHVLAGNYLNEPTITALLCLGGVLLGVRWLIGIRHAVFRDVGPWWLPLGIAVVAFGSPAFFLSGNPTFYAVPIAGAYFSLMLTLTLADAAVRVKQPAFRRALLALASFAVALTVGARPDYIATVAVVLVPAIIVWRDLPAERRRSRRAVALLALATLAPAAVAGIGLAIYNYVRFENPADFGIQYSMASASVRDIKLTGPEYIPKNLRLYVLHPAHFVRYFPFFLAEGRPFGVAPHFTLALGALLFPLTLLSRTLRANPRWIAGGLVLAIAAAANLAILCLFFGAEDRYLVDFAPGALLAGSAVLLAAAATPAGSRAMARRTVAAAGCAAAVWSVANGSLFAFSRRVDVPWLEGLGRGSNMLVAAVERLGGTSYGDLHLRVRFPASLSGQREPLVTTGTSASMADVVFALYTDPSHVQFGFFHTGAGGPIGEPVAIDYGREHELSIRLGSLYPPAAHPVLKSWAKVDVDAIRRQLEVRIDGKVALAAQVDVYESTPDRIEIGSNSLAPDVSVPRFRGSIVSRTRDPLPPAPLTSTVPVGPLRLRVRFPPERGGAAQPLVSTGISGKGDLLSIEFLADKTVRFIHDSWGSPDYKSDPILPAEAEEHTIEVEMGSLYPPGTAAAPELQHRLAVRIDGAGAMDVDRPFNPADHATVVVGLNAIRASSAVGMFSGAISAVEPAASIPRNAISEGPLRLRVRFPTDATGSSDPLLVTGHAGAADVLFVQYVDAGHVRFGIDHWGIGVTQGAPVAVDYAGEHTLDIEAPGLFRPGSPRAELSSPASGRTFAVRLDGADAFATGREAYPASPAEIAVGRNDISATSASRAFSGQILESRRLRE